MRYKQRQAIEGNTGLAISLETWVLLLNIASLAFIVGLLLWRMDIIVASLIALAILLSASV